MGQALLAKFFGAMLLRVPIGFSLALASLLGLWLVTDVPLAIGAQRLVAGITPFALLAIPLFILAGGVMNAGGITRRLLDLADSTVGGFRGGLAQTNVLSSLFFGGISGSAVADISSLGRILIPAMKAKDYRGAYTAAVTAAAPVVTPIMPPSITLIVYGVVSGTSIGQLFFAGLLPAILYIAMLMVAVHLTVRKQGFTKELVERTPDTSELGITAKDDRPKFLPSLWRALPALLLPLVILMGIRFGFFTPTEAAAIAVLYALVVGFFIYRELTLKKLLSSFADSAVMVGLIMLVLAAAQLYSYALTSEKVPQAVANAIFTLSDSPLVLLIMVNLLLIVVGMFIEANAALIIITPILFPVLTEAGVDPVHLGILVVVNLGIGLLTPPVGIGLMLSAEISKVSFLSAAKASLPFLLTGVLFLLLVTYVPQISLFLPELLLR